MCSEVSHTLVWFVCVAGGGGECSGCGDWERGDRRSRRRKERKEEVIEEGLPSLKTWGHENWSKLC